MTHVENPAYPRLDTERPVEGWENSPDNPYCPTYVEIGDGRIVKKTPVIGTATAVYSAWEPYTHSPEAPWAKVSHSTSTHVQGYAFGKIGTRSLPPELEVLAAGSDERIAQVRAYHRAQEEEAYALIRQAFPGREFRVMFGDLDAPI
jgi:hypothetical protein